MAKKPLFMGGGSSKVSVDISSIDAPYDYILKNADGIQCDYIPIMNDGLIDEGISKCIGHCCDEKYDAVICFVGNNYGPDCETECFDRDNLKLPNYLSAVLSNGIAAIDNFVIVTQFGSAVIPSGWENAKAIVQMWYTGEACGKAVADVLFGKVNPSGQLAETFMLKDRSDIDYPGDGIKVCYNERWNCGYRYYDKHPEEIWFPFGHGLSYTSFEYSDLKLSENRFNTDNFEFEVSVKIKNIGSVAGKEVVQLYISPEDSVVDRPFKVLKLFAKIMLMTGEEKTVYFNLEAYDFSYYNTCLHRWHVESVRYGILNGASSRDIRLKKEIGVAYDKDYTVLKYGGSMIL